MMGGDPLPPASPSFDCATADEALGAYALDVLDPDERAALEAHLQDCPACRAELDRYVATIDVLDAATSPMAPPAALRDRLLAEIGASPAAVPRPPDLLAPPIAIDAGRGPRDRVTLSRFAAAGLGLVASLLLAGIVVAGVLLHRAQGERDRAEAGQREVAEYLRDGGTITPLTAAPGADVGAAAGSLIVAPHQDEALLIVSGFAPSDNARRYHVWAARAGGRTRLADLSVTADGAGWIVLTAPTPLTTFDTVGITLDSGSAGRRDLLTAPVPKQAAGGA